MRISLSRLPEPNTAVPGRLATEKRIDNLKGV